MNGAALLAVGSELLRFGRSDTNSEWLTRRLNRHGIDVGLRIAVEDDLEAIADAVRGTLGRFSPVIVSGGLGPTDDDRTRQAVAAAIEVPLELDETVRERLVALFARFGRPYHPGQDVQAHRPRGAEWIGNPLGTAPGFRLQVRGSLLCVLPGVPAELKAMFDAAVAPLLRGGGLASRTLRVGGRTESSVDAQVRELYGLEGTSVTILAGVEGIELQLRAAGADSAAAQHRLDDLDRRMSGLLGEDLYGRDDEDLPGVVGRLLASAGATLATAESCTAGLLAGAVTRTPGSSAWFRGGLVVYADRLKRDLAGVDEQLLRDHGAVSEPVARALAEGVRIRCGADYGVGVTGLAGPGGGSEAKPIGLVHLAVAREQGISHWAMRMIGDREMIRRRTVTAALDRLRRLLQKSSE